MNRNGDDDEDWLYDDDEANLDIDDDFCEPNNLPNLIIAWNGRPSTCKRQIFK